MFFQCIKEYIYKIVKKEPFSRRVHIAYRVVCPIGIQIAIWLPNLRFSPNFRRIQQQNPFFLRRIIIFRNATAHFRSEIRFLLRKTPEIRAFSEAVTHIPICRTNIRRLRNAGNTRCRGDGKFSPSYKDFRLV